MNLLSIACSVPKTRYKQADLWPIYMRQPLSKTLRDGSNQMMKKLLLRDNGVTYRHFALDDVEALLQLDAEGLNHAFEKAGPELARDAVEKSLAGAGIVAGDLDALFVCTCTGYICPGLSSHVAEQLGLRESAYLQDIVGMGCGAAIPAIRSASAFCSMNPSARVAVVAVEICSAAFYLEDEGDVIISACLFGDGAAAVMLCGDAVVPGRTSWRFGDFDTVHLPEEREALRFVNHGGKLKNRLARNLPEVAGRAVSALWARHLAVAGGGFEILPHAGGRQILKALAEQLPQKDFVESAWALDMGGNMSSPSVLFALGAYLDRYDTDVPVSLPAVWGTPPRRRESANENALWLASFGAGFSAHSCSLVKSKNQVFSVVG